MTASEFKNAVRAAYEYAHENCHYAPTDQSFPVGDDGKMDCTGLVLRALYLLGLVNAPLNCDQMDALMPAFGFTKSEDIEDIYKHPVSVVQWCEPHNVGTKHVNHTYVAVGNHADGSIDKYDTGSDPRIGSIQPFERVPIDEWNGRLVFKWLWYLDNKDERGLKILIGGRRMKTVKLEQIRIGDEGNAVLLAQEIFKAREKRPGVPYYTGELDKKFGPKLEKAVIDYQTARTAMGSDIGGIDGIIGEKTWDDLLALPKV